jgi:uncharacterized membrane protein
MRYRNDHAVSGNAPFTLVLSFTALALTLFTAWLGGELVTRLGIGVSNDAHADAPSSLSDRVATRAA